MKRFCVLFVGVFILAHIFVQGVYASGAAETYNLDKAHTYVGFKVRYLVLVPIAGQFDDFKGSFVIDRDHPENNRADITIETASVNTGYEARDHDIRGPDLFDANRYPTIAFHSENIEMMTDNTGRIIGNLTLLGVTKPVQLDFVKGSGEDKDYADGFRVTGKIKRSDFGMNAFIQPIGNVVTLLVCYNMEDCDSGDIGQGKGRPKYNQ